MIISLSTTKCNQIDHPSLVLSDCYICCFEFYFVIWYEDILHTDRLIRLLSFLLSSFSQPSYYLGHFKGISRLGGIVPLLNINQLALHHVFEAIFFFQNAFFLTLMGDWAVVMPNKAGEKKTAPSQTLTVFLH